MIQIALIAALDKQRAIGFDNRLPWHLPNDLKRFKALTLGKTVLMGRKTATSLGRALPNRKNLVLTHHEHVPFEGMHAVRSWEAALAACESDTLMVIGGGEIYAQAISQATRMFLTHVDTVLAQADAFFPDFDAQQWRISGTEYHGADNAHRFEFSFTDYQRYDLNCPAGRPAT